MSIYTKEHLSDALTWIEHHAPGGISLVARALSETYPPEGAATPPPASEPAGNPGQLPKTPTCGRCGYPLSPCHQGIATEPNCGRCLDRPRCIKADHCIDAGEGLGEDASSPASDTGEAKPRSGMRCGHGHPIEACDFCWETATRLAAAVKPRDRSGCESWCGGPRHLATWPWQGAFGVEHVRPMDPVWCSAPCSAARLPPVSSEPPSDVHYLLSPHADAWKAFFGSAKPAEPERHAPTGGQGLLRPMCRQCGQPYSHPIHTKGTFCEHGREATDGHETCPR